MRLLALCALLVWAFCAIPAYAEFTAEEKLQINVLGDGTNALALTIEQVMAYARVKQSSIPQIRDYVLAVADMRHAMAAVPYWLGDGPSAVAKPRDAAILEAWKLLDNAAGRKNSVYTYLGRLETACGTPCQDAKVKNARGLVDKAVASIETFNRTLAYANPIVPENEPPFAPGAYRGKSPAIHPHGDHQRVFERQKSHEQHTVVALRNLMSALMEDPTFANDEVIWGSEGHTISFLAVNGLILMLGVESDVPFIEGKSIKQMVDDLCAGLGGNRIPRHFCRLMIAMELWISGSHDQDDVNFMGRRLVKGIPYSLNQQCISIFRRFTADGQPAKITETVNKLVQDLGLNSDQASKLNATLQKRGAFIKWASAAGDNICGDWFQTDSLAGDAVIFSRFPTGETVEPPPIDPPPPDCPACPTCPAQVGVLHYDPTGVTASCEPVLRHHRQGIRR